MKSKFIKTALLKVSPFIALLLLCAFADDSLKKAQMKYSHVKTAYDEKWNVMEQLLKEKQISSANFEIYIRTFKYEKKLELWARNISKENKKYALLKTYNICSSSGELGPKRREGDGQVPEGFYEIDLLNPTSDYYLSMRVSYPNSSDRIRGNKKSLGGAIMVHGNCVTIGCIPITDECIKEVYILAVEAKNRGKKIPIDIFPCHLTDKNCELLAKNYSPELISFWDELREGYDYFEKNKCTAPVVVDKSGKYSIKK